MSKRLLKFEVIDIDALEKAHPDCVSTITSKIFDRSKVYTKIKAAHELGIAIPGVEIFTDDPIDDTQALLKNINSKTAD